MPPDVPAHKDRYGEPCRGEARAVKSGREMSRRCLGCGRLEYYEPDTLIVIFKKGVAAMDALRYLAQFRFSRRQPQVGGKAEKNGCVALIVSIPLAADETLETWIRALEEPHPDRGTPVLFASRVLRVDFEFAAGWR